MNNGSRDSLKVSLRWGLSANARQTRPTVEALRPQARAIDSRLQCVAPRGVVSSVRTTTRSTSSSVTRRDAPGRGSSSKPSQPLRRNRRRHLPTVARVVPRACATAWSLRPAALCSTMRARRPEPARYCAGATNPPVPRAARPKPPAPHACNGSARPSSLPGRPDHKPILLVNNFRRGTIVCL